MQGQSIKTVEGRNYCLPCPLRHASIRPRGPPANMHIWVPYGLSHVGLPKWVPHNSVHKEKIHVAAQMGPAALPVWVLDGYNQYIHSIITDQPENAEQPAMPNKRFWTLIKQQKSDSKEITSLKSNGVTYTKASDKANILNGQFQSVFTKPVPLKLKHLAELILPRKLISPTMPNINITVNGVSKQLSKLNPGKAAGPDNLTSRILKELHSEVVPMLSDIFNSSLREGKVPDDRRNASVSPVYKKGAKTKAENYRPISLTCICCKVMEHVITSNIMAYLDKHQLLHSNQHGFRKKLSCETQLIQFVQDISDTLNESG